MANNNDMIAFKLSRKGYNREDVNKYIAEMNRRFSETESEFRAVNRQLEEQKTRFPELHERLEEVQRSYAALSRENTAITEKCADLIKQNDIQAEKQLKLESELMLLRAKLDESNAAKSSANVPTTDTLDGIRATAAKGLFSEPAASTGFDAPSAENNSSPIGGTAASDTARAESDTARVTDTASRPTESKFSFDSFSLSEDSSRKLGESMIRAELEGNSIRARAKAEADEIVAAAKAQSEAIIAEGRAEAKAMIDNTHKRLSDMTEEYLRVITQFQTKSLKDYDASLYLLTKKLKDLSADIDSSSDSVFGSIKE